MENETVSRKRIRIPDWKWLLLGGFAVFVITVGLMIGVPYWRLQLAIAEIKNSGGRLTLLYDEEQRVPTVLKKYFFHVQSVDFNQNFISESCFEQLGKLERLESLSLLDTSITDKDLQFLSQSGSLKYLYLYHSEISNEGMKHLSGLTKLRGLFCFDTNVTNEGLQHLGQLTELAYLNLENTKISDEGLKYLKGTSNLKWLDVRKTLVTSHGVDELRKRLPNCEIDSD